MAEGDRERWDRRYREGAASEPAGWLVELAAALPVTGRALELAGGAGRNAIWLARRGLSVTLVDVSPVGLELASRRARAQGLELDCRALDLESAAPPAGPWDLIVVVDYLQRSLLSGLAGLLIPGGAVAISHPTRTNLERHARPSARFLLAPGELAVSLSGLAIERYEEGWTAGGRHEARAWARRLPARPGG